MRAELDDDAIVGINVTPLIDVVLVLLVALMVGGAAATEVFEVETGGASAAPETLPLDVRIDARGAVTIDGRAVSLGDLRLDRDAATITSAREVSHGRFVEVLDALRGAGVHRYRIAAPR